MESTGSDRRPLFYLPTLVRAALALVGLQLTIATAFRFVFWLSFHSAAGAVASQDWLRAWTLGLRFDLRLALWTCVPFLLLGALPALHPSRSARMRRLWLAYFVAAEAAIVLVLAVDLGYFGYLHARLDAGSLDLLGEIGIALEMVWQTYPVLPGGAALVALVALYWLAAQRLAFRRFERPAAAPTRSRRWPGVVATALVVVLGIYGKWSWYPLRWSDAYFGTDPFVSAMALNPVLYFVDTLPNRESEVDLEALRTGYTELARLLEVDDPDPATLSLRREVTPAAALPGTPNLVVIHLESFAAYKAGAFGNALDATPHFDRIAERSILFTHFFVPSGPTARSVFTMLTGIPDLNPNRSASRNPRAVSQRTVLESLTGYDKLYFLGGSATWGNIRGLLAHNLDGLEIFEEGSYDLPRGDVWGISDLHLFEAAHRDLASRRRPFFAFIQTAGNHRPYTIPEDRRGFELAELDEEPLRENGFENLEAYNGLRFLDHALGRFFELAESDPYFRNTVFALYGDHGGPTPLATPWNSIGLTTNHVPGVLYAPGFLDQGRRVDSVASLADLLPTALSFLGTPYVNTTLGRDALAKRPPGRQFALLSDGLATPQLLLRVDPAGSSRLYRYRSPQPDVDVAARLPERHESLLRLHGTLEAAALHLLENNER